MQSPGINPVSYGWSSHESKVGESILSQLLINCFLQSSVVQRLRVHPILRKQAKACLYVNDEGGAALSCHAVFVDRVQPWPMHDSGDDKSSETKVRSAEVTLIVLEVRAILAVSPYKVVRISCNIL